MSRLTQTAPLPSSAPEPPRAEPSCVATVQRFARHLGLSRRVATRRLYQHRWECHWSWCSSRGHSVSYPFIPKIADFLMFLRTEKHLSVAAIKGYHSTLVSVFKFHLPEPLDSFVLRDLIRSFEIERARRPVGPPSWDLVKVVTHLHGSTFELLASKPLRLVTMKVFFLLALATAKRAGELQTPSWVASHGPDISLTYLTEFVVTTESERNPLPFSFLVRSIEEFVGDLPEEHLLCPIQAIGAYLSITASILPCPRSLLDSPKRPSRVL